MSDHTRLKAKAMSHFKRAGMLTRGAFWRLYGSHELPKVVSELVRDGIAVRKERVLNKRSRRYHTVYSL